MRERPPRAKNNPESQGKKDSTGLETSKPSDVSETFKTAEAAEIDKAAEAAKITELHEEFRLASESERKETKGPEDVTELDKEFRLASHAERVPQNSEVEPPVEELSPLERELRDRGYRKNALLKEIEELKSQEKSSRDFGKMDEHKILKKERKKKQKQFREEFGRVVPGFENSPKTKIENQKAIIKIEDQKARAKINKDYQGRAYAKRNEGGLSWVDRAERKLDLGLVSAKSFIPKMFWAGLDFLRVVPAFLAMGVFWFAKRLLSSLNELGKKMRAGKVNPFGEKGDPSWKPDREALSLVPKALWGFWKDGAEKKGGEEKKNKK